MEKPFLNRLGSVLWAGLIILVVALAMYLSVGRLLTANLGNFRVEILQALNARLPVGLDAQQVSGEWQSFTPVIVLTELSLSLPGSASPPLQLSSGRIGVDVLNSLRTRSLQMTHLVLDGLSLRGELSGDGTLTLGGFGSGNSSQAGAPIRELLLNIERISLRNNRLLLTLPNKGVRDLALNLELLREGSQRDVQATLMSATTGARIAILAQGLGDPFTPEAFAGQVYLDMQSTDLGAIQDLFSGQAPTVWADGAVDLELWLDWNRGTPSVRARLRGGDLQVASSDASWQLSLARLALEARLQRRDDRWTLFVANLQLGDDRVDWALPHLQLDSWDNALRVRTDRFALEPLNTILTGQVAAPEVLREVFSVLHPRGDITALQLRIDDVKHSATSWELAANFEDVAVESWHGAPGITAARGYTQLTDTGGLVILDGHAMSLDFPSVYHQPLQFDDLHGSLHLNWDAEAVRLSSGLLTTHGEEGTAKVLFGLDIPLQENDIGVEMELLVGLQDTRPVHRGKFIPYILDPVLLSWLHDSIGEGMIEQGAFLWRGSLRAGAAPLRTVQLAFNVADTQLSYHPQWPPVLVEQGIVVINDTAVSVWAERASLFESTVEHLSVETRLDAADHLTLDVQGRVNGPVADGVTVLRESPLADVVGSTFAGWTASGNLQTDLRLHMNLSDTAAAPRVDVATQWRDVDVLMTPGNLPLHGVNGTFKYSTTTGFSARGLEGTLWGNPISATLQQHHGVNSSVYSPVTTVVDVELATQVDMADLSRWLQVDSVAFASGKAAADIVIRLAPGAPPRLAVSSDLQGVSLDLPQPWQKPAQESRHFQLEMPLAQGVMPVSLTLGEQLQFQLMLDAGELRGGAIGFNALPPPIERGVLRVAGHTPLLQVDEWTELFTQYSGATGAISSGPAPGGAPLRIAVDELRADTVQVLGREVQDVVFSLALEDAQWELTLATDWLRGKASHSTEDDPVQLAIAYLDLDRLPGVQPRENDEEGNSEWQMPALDVNLANLYQSDRRLGQLSFVLREQADALAAENITGELAGLRLSAGEAGQLVWRRGTDEFTEVQASLQFADLGQTLEHFDYQRIVQTQGGEFVLDLQWPGAPQDFSLAAARGSMQVDIDSGSFLQAPASASGALRVVSILNLADIVRRLSLANTLEEGIPFDSVEGEVGVADGTVTVVRMDVQGGSSFQFSGESDVQSEKLQGELVATLPVVNNLPWIAALAASLPVAAGVYVVSQVFNKQMNRLSSAVYTISGSWDDPEVSFDRIFDNTPQAVPDGASERSPREGDAPAAEVSAPDVDADTAATAQSASP